MRLNRLTELQVKRSSISEGERLLFDGGGLYLRIRANGTPSGARVWLFSYKADGKRRRRGLGSYPEVTLAQARALTAEGRAQLARGIDPVTAAQDATVQR